MAVLSLIIIVLSFFFGYFYPRKALWFVALTFPLLNPANVTIIPSEILFLNISRISSAMILAVHLKRGKRLRFDLLLKSKFIRIFLFFSVWVILISLGDRAKNMIFSYIPNLYISLTLGYFLIKEEKDYKVLIKILSCQALLFSAVVFLDFFNIINLQLIVAQWSPNFSLDFVQINDIRAGLSRVAGWDGNSIYSATRLVVLFPIALLNWKLKKGLFRLIIPVIIAGAILLLMSRAAYISFVVTLVFIIFWLSYLKKQFLTKVWSIVRYFIAASLLAVILYNSVPVVKTIVDEIYFFTFQTNDVTQRQDRLPRATKYIMEKPLLGHGSPYYSYMTVMDTDDIPTFYIYALTGGFPLLILLIIWWVYMPLYFVRYLKKRFITKEQSNVIIYASTAFVGGLVPMLANWNQVSLVLMIIIFGATYRYLMINNIIQFPVRQHMKKEIAPTKISCQINK